ncbi:MAG: histidine phosphatase family protein [Anaerolineales bacterium]|jgi:phosphohistidine phosphatase
MKLYFLRHSTAFERNPETYPDDRLRPLTNWGRKKMVKIARLFPKLDIQVGLILSSPFLRASETAVIARKALGLKKDRLILTDRLAPLGEADQLIAEIQANYTGTDLLLVGHEPDLNELISMLLVNDTSLSLRLNKGGICCLSTNELMARKCATLEWMLNPSQMLKM